VRRRWRVAPAWLLALVLASAGAMAGKPSGVDPAAENMLLLQTASGGWSKHYRDRKVDYARVLDDAERAALRAPGRRDDATIDNKATTSEIAYLLQAHARTGNAAYLIAAGRGVDYLLKAQYPTAAGRSTTPIARCTGTRSPSTTMRWCG